MNFYYGTLVSNIRRMLQVKIKKAFRNNAVEKLRGARSNTGGGPSDNFALDVEFVVPPGVAILFGASGSGKSLTLKCIAGIARPDEGTTSINERVLFDSARGINLPIRARRTGFVFQDLALFPHFSALRNVEFAMADLPPRERRERATHLLESFDIGHVADRRPRNISGGEAQRVALARALAARPDILLLDEPLSALDDATKLGIVADLKRINRELRLPVIYVTHDREEAVTLGERIIVYERGHVVATGAPLEVFAAPQKSSVAHLTSVENIFAGGVLKRNAGAGTMTVEITDGVASCLIDVPLGNFGEGERVTIAVRAGDILLAIEEPRGTSARNVLRGRIASIEKRSDQMLVRVASSDGVSWAVSVTRQAVSELRLAIGSDVWLAIKSYSCHLLDE